MSPAPGWPAELRGGVFDVAGASRRICHEPPKSRCSPAVTPRAPLATFCFLLCWRHDFMPIALLSARRDPACPDAAVLGYQRQTNFSPRPPQGVVRSS